MLFSVFILPVVIMIVVMSLISNMSQKAEQDVEEHVPVVYVENAPAEFEGFLGQTGIACEVRDVKDREKLRDQIRGGEADLWIEFPEHFAEAVGNYQKGDEIVQVKTYYNPSEEYSRAAFDAISTGALEMYRQTLLAERVDDMQKLTVFTVNSDNPDMIIQDDQKAGGKVLGTMLPYFVTILLFAGAMGIGTDMVAGEKERGDDGKPSGIPDQAKLYRAGKGICADDHFRGIVGSVCGGHGGIHAPDAGRGVRRRFGHQPDAERAADWNAGTLAGGDLIFVFGDHCTGVCICKDG